MSALLAVSTLAYLSLGAALTVWVARVLFRHGGPFLRDAFRGNAELGDSVNHLLVVGFYLVNLGYLSATWHVAQEPEGIDAALELVSGKLGRLLLMLGAMHFANVYLLSALGRSGLADRWLPAPAPAPSKP
jgi:hypothetical protein